jgi:hypothetical protein
MKPVQVVGATVVVGGLLWWWMSSAKTKKPRSIPALPPKNAQYPIPAETNKYPAPPASQVLSQPSISLGTACPTISTPDEYNAYATQLGLPLFTDILPTNAPDDPRNQAFATLVSGLKTMAGCFAPPDQDDISTALPSDYGNQSASYK